MILLDTSGLLAAMFSDQQQHHACARVLLEAEGALLLSPFVLSELADTIGKLAGVGVELEMLEEVSRGAYRLVEFTAADVEEARGVISRYRKLEISLADASIVVLARRYGVNEILTLDQRHFRTLRGAHGRPFRILPADLT